MPATAKEIGVRWFEEVWNRKNEQAIDELFDPNGECYGFPDANSSVGIDGFKETYRSFCSAFPDIQVEIHDSIVDDNHAAFRWTARMTHTGDGLGFAPTGLKTSLTGSSFFIAENGKIQTGWNYMDMSGFMENLRKAAVAIPAT